MSFAAVQDHALARRLELPARAKVLWRDLRNSLIAGSNTGALRTSPNEIHRLVRLLDEPPPTVADELRVRDLLGSAHCIVGGEKNQHRDRGVAHLVRDDEAWFDFTITVRERTGELELLAYNFEIRFPAAMGAPFLRFDLNLPEHRNEDRELRSHLHPGSDDVHVPSPLMSPAELVALFVDGLRRPTNREKWRAPTAFELQWLRASHDELAARSRPS
jgi:hypothetical protein